MPVSVLLPPLAANRTEERLAGETLEDQVRLWDELERLRSTLLDGYKPDIRPTISHTSPVTVYLNLFLTHFELSLIHI